jgi:hypothetical protein
MGFWILLVDTEDAVKSWAVSHVSMELQSNGLETVFASIITVLMLWVTWLPIVFVPVSGCQGPMSLSVSKPIGTVVESGDQSSDSLYYLIWTFHATGCHWSFHCCFMTIFSWSTLVTRFYDWLYKSGVPIEFSGCSQMSVSSLFHYAIHVACHSVQYCGVLEVDAVFSHHWLFQLV